MPTEEKIANLTIHVPYHGSGNVIRQKEIKVDVYKSEGHYKIIPLLDINERRLANLPEVLMFSYEHGHVRSLRGKFDGNFHVIEDIVTAMKEKNII